LLKQHTILSREGHAIFKILLVIYLSIDNIVGYNNLCQKHGILCIIISYHIISLLFTYKSQCTIEQCEKIRGINNLKLV